MFSSLFLEPIRTLLVAAAIFIPFERLAAERAGQRIFRQGWATDILTGFANGLLLLVVVLIVLTRIDAVAAICVPNLRTWMETRPVWAQAALALMLGDLGIYGIHRLSHTVPWLWRFHAVHHSAEELDWLVGFRFHPVDLLLTRVASLGPLVALHLSPAALAVFVAVSAWQGWLLHANVRIRYGPLRWLIVSPEFHHWHHSAEREAYDSNYANILACWDVLLGTVHLPRGRRPDRYGVDEYVPPGWVNRFFHPFRRADPPDAWRVVTQATRRGREATQPPADRRFASVDWR
jgi:sterol desaturase/sphingolipid hydroxylase (fatty acid hydroxylase superfamily)